MKIRQSETMRVIRTMPTGSALIDNNYFEVTLYLSSKAFYKPIQLVVALIRRHDHRKQRFGLPNERLRASRKQPNCAEMRSHAYPSSTH